MVVWTLGMDLVAQASEAAGSFRVIGQYAAVGLVLTGLVLLVVIVRQFLRAKATSLDAINNAAIARLSAAQPERVKASAAPAPAEPAGAAAPARPDLAEAQRLFALMGDAEDLATRLSAELDRRTEQLARLIEQADARLARLEQLRADLRIDNPSPPPPATARPPMAPPMAHAAPYASPRPATEVEQAEPPRPVVNVPRRGAPAAAHAQPGHAYFGAPAPTPPALEPSASSSLDPITVEVYRLADQGHHPRDIAKRLGQHIGKVELILALRH